jgi:hypothetical protein
MRDFDRLLPPSRPATANHLEEVITMTLYQMYFVDETNRIAIGEDVECTDDSAALRNARAALRHRDYPAVEVWDHTKWVGRAKRFDWITPARRASEGVQPPRGA